MYVCACVLIFRCCFLQLSNPIRRPRLNRAEQTYTITWGPPYLIIYLYYVQLFVLLISYIVQTTIVLAWSMSKSAIRHILFCKGIILLSTFWVINPPRKG